MREDEQRRPPCATQTFCCYHKHSRNNLRTQIDGGCRGAAQKQLLSPPGEEQAASSQGASMLMASMQPPKGVPRSVPGCCPCLFWGRGSVCSPRAPSPAPPSGLSAVLLLPVPRQGSPTRQAWRPPHFPDVAPDPGKGWPAPSLGRLPGGRRRAGEGLTLGTRARCPGRPAGCRGTRCKATSP